MAEPTHIQSGGLLAATNVAGVETPANVPLLLILASASEPGGIGAWTTPTHKNSSGVTKNTFTKISSNSDGYQKIEYWLTNGAYAISTSSGDLLNIPGASIPVFWALWQLNDCLPEYAFGAGGSTAYFVNSLNLQWGSYIGTIRANQTYYTADLYQRAGILIGCAFADNSTTAAWPRPFKLTQWSVSTGADVSSGSQWQTSGSNRYYFVSVGKEVTQNSGWNSQYSFTRSSTSGTTYAAGGLSYIRILPNRTEDPQRTKPILSSITRSARY